MKTGSIYELEGRVPLKQAIPLGIQHVSHEEDIIFVPAKDLDFYERVKYYDRYEYFKGVGKPYKIEDYHVIIKDGELHRYKVK